MVLRGLSLDMAQGEFAALIGPNGHGKTTLLRTISGLVRAVPGRSRYMGQDIDAMRPDQIVAAGIIHVPQGDLLFPEMTVLENLRMGAYLPEPPPKRPRAWRRSSRSCQSCASGACRSPARFRGASGGWSASAAG
jgi:branched-chain amino acid transport system ATP-binding protein